MTGRPGGGGEKGAGEDGEEATELEERSGRRHLWRYRWLLRRWGGDDFAAGSDDTVVEEEEDWVRTTLAAVVAVVAAVTAVTAVAAVAAFERMM